MATYFYNIKCLKDLKVRKFDTKSDIFEIVNNSNNVISFFLNLQGGGGMINDATTNAKWEKDRNRWYSIAGAQGTTINVFINNKLFLQALGGQGSLGGVVRRWQQMYWHEFTDSSGNVTGGEWRTKWDGKYDNHRIKREGQVKFLPILLQSNDALKLQFIDNGGYNAQAEILPFTY